jgi:hypothetical protein
MKTLELEKILELHNLWTRGEVEGKRARLIGADLRRADLRKANLSKADLTEADLTEADLTEADLTEADLTEADLHRADLRYLYMTRCILVNANLTDAILRGADLRGADLRGADLRYAILNEAMGPFATFSGGRDYGIATCTHISIGCEWHTHDEWRKCYAVIGDANGYTPEEIERYRQWIFSLDWLIQKEE